MAPNIPVGRSFSGFIDLPMLSGDVTVGGALDTMVANMRSAVIVDVGRFHYLHTARSVLTAPKLVHPDDALLSVLSATGAPHFPVVDPSSEVPWMTLSTDPKVLLRHGIIETVPNGRVRIDRKSTRLNSSHTDISRMSSSAWKTR